MIGGTRPGGGILSVPPGRLEDRLSTFTESWPFVIGVIIALFVLFLPRGIWGTLTGGFHGRQGA